MTCDLASLTTRPRGPSVLDHMGIQTVRVQSGPYGVYSYPFSIHHIGLYGLPHSIGFDDILNDHMWRKIIVFKHQFLSIFIF